MSGFLGLLLARASGVVTAITNPNGYTKIGGATDGGGLAAAFDGVTSQTQAQGALGLSASTVGLDFGTAFNIVRWQAWSSTDWGFNGTGNGVCTMAMRYSDDGSSWTTADSIAGVSDAGGVTIDRTFASAGSHRYWRMEKTAGGGQIRVAELVFWYQ